MSQPRVGVLAFVLGCSLAVTGCKTTDDITAAALSTDIAATYGHLAGTTTPASCVRHRGQGAQYGAGKDWSCTLGSGSGARTYSVTARPNGCYSATDSATGPVVTGPRSLRADALLPSFDGCLPA